MSTPDTPSVQSLPSKPSLTLDAARQIVANAEKAAIENGLRLSIAIVDDGGHLIHFVRMDGIHAATVEVSVAKARTAAMFRKPTQTFADALAEGAQGILSIDAMTPLPGGVPLLFKGIFVGAIGVSGAAPAIDAMIAEAGASTLIG